MSTSPVALAESENALPRVGRAEEGVIVDRCMPMEGAFELVVRSKQAARVHPGQFFQIGVGAPHTLLRRPYSAAWADAARGQLGFIFNVVGAGSEWLSHLRQGDEIDLLGPLGHGFDLDGRGDVICVAGGLGVAVFPGVVRSLLQRRRHARVLVGARTASQLLPAERFPGAEVLVATDDGSAGQPGSVVDLLLKFPPPPLVEGGFDIFACGPTPMLLSLVKQAERLRVPLASIQLALETPMGCGIGTCLGCVAPKRGGGYVLTCQQGPCVRADELDWTRMVDAFHG